MPPNEAPWRFQRLQSQALERRANHAFSRDQAGHGAPVACGRGQFVGQCNHAATFGQKRFSLAMVV